MTAPPRVGLRLVEVGGQRLRISVRPGDGSGPPLLLCNGIGASLELLQPFVDHLDPRIEAISFDVPGAGGSPDPARPYRFSSLGRLLQRLLDQLGYHRFDALGISWGGGLAQQLAVQNSRRCRRLVLASTGTGALMVPGRPEVLAKMVTPRRYRDREYAASIAAQLYGGRMRAPGVDAGALHNELRAGTRRGYWLQLLAGAGWTSLPQLPLIRQSTLILTGDDDPIVPAINGRIMARLIPNSTLYVFHDGHLGLLTSAAELGPLVSRFLLS